MMFYRSQSGKEGIVELLEKLEVSDKVRTLVALRNLDEDKTNRSNILDIRKVKNGIFELRIGIIRVFFTYVEDDICILHIFKKNSSTSSKELDKALRRAAQLHQF